MTGHPLAPEAVSLYKRLAGMNAATSQQALDLAGADAVHWSAFLFAPLAVFLEVWLAGKWRKGLDGFLDSWLAALETMLLKMKIWHLQQHPDGSAGRQERVRP